jgi:hypothetical protein
MQQSSPRGQGHNLDETRSIRTSYGGPEQGPAQVFLSLFRSVLWKLQRAEARSQKQQACNCNCKLNCSI